MPESQKRFWTQAYSDRATIVILLGCIVAVLIAQTSTLFSVPVFDSYRWWGDESWLMVEFREQMHSGIFRHPYALGATISHSNGLVFGSMWITAALYGLPELILHSDLVVVGRIVTLIVSIATVCVIVNQTDSENRIYALFGVLLLISTRVFLFTSHSARYDMLTGFAILCVMLISIERLLRPATTSVILWGLAFGAAPLVTPHAVLVLIPLGIYVVAHVIRHNNLKGSVLFVLGLVLPFVACLAAQYCIQGSVSLFGGSGSSGFASNIVHIPILHPTSRNILVTSLLQKLESAKELAIIIPYVVLISILAEVVIVVRSRTLAAMPTERRAGWLVVCGYLLFESSQFFYVIFVLPAIIVIAISLLQTMQHKPRRATSVTIICASLALSVFAITDVLKAKRIGEALEDGNRSASLAMRSYLDQHAANPLVLFASPTLHTGLQWPEVRPMTTQFQIFPVDTSQERSLLQWSPDYIEIIASGPASFYIGEVSDLKAIAQTHGDPVLRQPAYILDAGRSYFAPLDMRQDTLLLFRWR